MYGKYNENMKILALLSIIVLTTMTSSQPVSVQNSTINLNQSIIDENFFKRELQNSVLEFCEDLGVDPDSVYIPFRDEL